jgi:hypothetical protein
MHLNKRYPGKKRHFITKVSHSIVHLPFIQFIAQDVALAKYKYLNTNLQTHAGKVGKCDSLQGNGKANNSTNQDYRKSFQSLQALYLLDPNKCLIAT